jgi:HAD superfamily hydrolase (TIGR01549 family)
LKAAEQKLAILDIDGTLVDSNYQHAMAWWAALGNHGVDLPLWQVHRHIGMGGDQLVQALAGEQVEDSKGDAIREAEAIRYQELIGDVKPLAGARQAIAGLAGEGWKVVLASSAKPDEVKHYVELLEARDFLEDFTDSGDVSATKPDPDLIESALENAGADADEAVMVGDSIWDLKAASRAGVVAVGVLTGGFGKAELLEAGAAKVIESVADLNGRLLDGLVSAPD